MKDAASRDREARRKAEHDAYERRKAAGYYADKLATKTDTERAAEAERKRAERRTNGAEEGKSFAELLARRQKIFDIAEEQQPATVRAIFYQCVVAGFTPKDGYKTVQRDLAVMRRGGVQTPLAGEMPFDWIVDTSRDEDHPAMFTNAADALEYISDCYRQSLWEDAECVVQVWLEKDALHGVLSPVTHKYDVPLMIARGFSSMTFLREAAEALIGEKRPIYVYHFGDHDYYGQKAAAAIERDLNGWSDGANIKFKRLAVTETQIRSWNLPTRPANLNPNDTKAGATKAAEWGDKPTTELDAIAPNRLRALLENELRKHLPDKRMAALKRQGKREREKIRNLIGLAL